MAGPQHSHPHSHIDRYLRARQAAQNRVAEAEAPGAVLGKAERHQRLNVRLEVGERRRELRARLRGIEFKNAARSKE